jgi:oxalate decarboxylase/phosphoglucose isomerase-like protein (cupin superfamily)
MDHDQTGEMQAGDVVRTPAGSIHGVNNTGREPFVYLAVTTPPRDFTPAYRMAEFKLTSSGGRSTGTFRGQVYGHGARARAWRRSTAALHFSMQ